ncbi:PQ loop repeat protein [Onchocerca flexuosa]|uniref:Solute carrier family 66 member 2 n=1 Tax=Onchocerca flexuosa TaxID=387005 RepID=A0A238C6K3_9BILA|nr:PQ loop repeat protein [Onchocerca flexuosa]
MNETKYPLLMSGVDLIPLEKMCFISLNVLVKIFIIFGGSLAYVFQYKEISERKDASGFSLFVCLTLLVANILRIMFWFGKRFELALLAQSIVMLISMILMLEISVRINRKHVCKTQRASAWTGQLISHFWQWNDLSSYFVLIIAFIIFSSVLTYLLNGYVIYVEILGLIALLTEACLGFPQLKQNCSRRSTSGMSIGMVLIWMIGDFSKTAYFIYERSPVQFWLCGIIQIIIDLLIMLQVYCFDKRATKSRSQLPRTNDCD